MGGAKMVRKATLVWVCLSNLLFAGIVLNQLIQERSLHQLLENRMPWQEYSLPLVSLLILLGGIILEFLHSKLAFFVNAGFFLLAAAYAANLLMSASQDPEARIFGWLWGIPAALVLFVDLFLY